MLPCPCCGYCTLAFRQAYLTCPICLWTDDDKQPHEESEVNESLNLVRAQVLFQKHGYIFSKMKDLGRKPTIEEARPKDWQSLIQQANSNLRPYINQVNQAFMTVTPPEYYAPPDCCEECNAANLWLSQNSLVSPNFMNTEGGDAIVSMCVAGWQYMFPHIIRLVVEPNSWKLVDALLSLHIPYMLSCYDNNRVPHTQQQRTAIEAFHQTLLAQQHIRYYEENEWLLYNSTIQIWS